MIHTFLIWAVFLSSSVAVFVIAGWVRSSVANREGRRRFASQADDLARKTKELQRCKDFINSLEPLMIKSSGDGADYGARYRFWEKTALLLWGLIREQSAQKQREAKLDLGYTIVEALLSHVMPHPRPRRCL